MKLTELQERLKTYRLSEEEYEMMKSRLGREPLAIEWPLFSALWSEHCSYKSSKVHLRKFSYRNARTPDMDGENAGIVDLGYGEKVAFKMESHNHPSFIEPVQGSATGVGGILRDIFTMGARPIMSANYLCFGQPSAHRMGYLMEGVAKGISSYGNCVGVPTVTGQTNFNARYNKNILVNALNVGYFGPDQKMALSQVKGPGNFVVYVGAKTGRDGVHGASMASASFDEDSDSKKPNVQIGDPFYEKLLIEACLEVLAADYVIAMQDMGAAGLTSSSFEMSSKGQLGLEIDLKKVPLRDQTMTAEDILLSESQERMLLICLPENFEKLHQIFKKWGLDAVILGHVRRDKKIKLLWGPETLTEIDPDIIVEEAPKYKRDYSPWSSRAQVTKSTPPSDFDPRTFLQTRLDEYKLNSQLWIHNQFDQRVGARTAAACESSVAFCRLDHSGRGLGLAVGCRPEIMQVDARVGALDAVYYPALQMALKGAETLAVTDCLNFGNPQKKEIMSEFVASVEAIAQASRELDAPVISGNVSFYNETLGENIISTPATGLISIRENVENLIPDGFTQEFEHIILVRLDWIEGWFAEGEKKAQQAGYSEKNQNVAEFIKKCSGLQKNLCEKKGLRINAIKAVGLGGFATTCLKMSFNRRMGFDLSYDNAEFPLVNQFKDTLYSFLIATSDKPENFISELKNYFNEFTLEVRKIGETRSQTIRFSDSCVLDPEKFFNEYSKGVNHGF
jgi:phosphoribosylformylglycinamidine synthase II